MVPKDARDLRTYRRGVFRPSENVEGHRWTVAPRALLASDQNVEAVNLLPVKLAERRHQADVLRFRVTAVLQASGDGDIELARKIAELFVAQQNVVKFLDDRRGVEQLMRRQPGDGTAAHAADIVHAGLLARQADFFQAPPDIGHVAKGEPAHLDLLARR